MRHGWLFLCALAVVLAQPAAALLPPPMPLMVRVAANGQSAAVFDHKYGALNSWWVRPYQSFAPGKPTVDVLHDLFWGLAPVVDGKVGKGTWAPQMPLSLGTKPWQPSDGINDTVFGYWGATGIVRETRLWPGPPPVALTTLVFAPMTAPGRCLAVLARVASLSQSGPIKQDFTLALLVNLHMGSGSPHAGSDAEQLEIAGPGTLLERGLNTDHHALVRGLAPWDGTPTVQNIYAPFQLGVPLQLGEVGKAVGNDLVGALVVNGLSLSPLGQTLTGALVCYDSTDVAAPDIHAWLAGRNAEQLLADEQAWWQKWHAVAPLPIALPDNEVLTFQRQLTLLKMAQCQQPELVGPWQGQTPFGQIVASLPPGEWNITWPRDQSYAGVALAASGHLPEAKAALAFVLQGKAGQFQAQVGAPYRVSVTRYFGGGLEESDSNEDGPNIELDGFGLVLWQAARYVQAANDVDFVAKWWPDLRDLVAAPLLQAIDATGLIKPDSSIWEVHWNGKQKHFAYTSIAAVRGLCGAAQLATVAGQGALAAQYRQQATQLRDAIVANLAPAGTYLRGNVEEPPQTAADLAAIEALLDGQIAPWGPVAQSSWNKWRKTLQAGSGPGFVRNDDGGWYDSQEWLFIDLRVLHWMERALSAGAPLQAERDELRKRVLQVAAAGGGLVPELVQTTGTGAGQFAGALPMMGFGAGVLALVLGGEAYGDDLAACVGAPASPAAVAVADNVADAAADAAVADVAAAPEPVAADSPAADAASLGAASDLASPAIPQVQSATARGCAGAPRGASGWTLAWAICVAWLAMRRKS